MEIKTRVLPADEAGVAEAAQLLRQGQLVALPTETVYGIAADARNGAAVAKIFVAKGRPQDNPLIVHVTGPEMLPGLVSEVPERAQLLMPYHVLQDAYEEERLGGKAFGSTKSGIAPFYSDKYAKIGIQVCDLFDEPRLRERLTAAVAIKNVLFEHLYHKPALNVDEL
ncbi:MAG: adenylosuccinate synthetase, partial [Faecalibacterium sp.]|nr:adenylosuccinate synthetase [Faecalibacterium sp.]